MIHCFGVAVATSTEQHCFSENLSLPQSQRHSVISIEQSCTISQPSVISVRPGNRGWLVTSEERLVYSGHGSGIEGGGTCHQVECKRLADMLNDHDRVRALDV